MNKRFHIKIVDNDTNEVALDVDTDCIVGAVQIEQDGREGSICLGYSDCNSMRIANTAYGAIEAGKRITNNAGASALLTAILAAKALGKKEEESKDGVDAERSDEGTVIPFPTSRKDK